MQCTHTRTHIDILEPHLMHTGDERRGRQEEYYGWDEKEEKNEKQKQKSSHNIVNDSFRVNNQKNVYEKYAYVSYVFERDSEGSLLMMMRSSKRTFKSETIIIFSF